MKKNPGRRERRALRKRSRTGRSAKLSAINERKLLRLSKRKGGPACTSTETATAVPAAARS